MIRQPDAGYLYPVYRDFMTVKKKVQFPPWFLAGKGEYIQLVCALQSSCGKELVQLPDSKKSIEITSYHNGLITCFYKDSQLCQLIFSAFKGDGKMH